MAGKIVKTTPKTTKVRRPKGRGKQEDRYKVRSLARGLAILERFKHGPLRLTDLSTALKVDKATLFRYCTTLTDLQYLDIEPITKEYRLGAKARGLGYAALVQPDIIAVVRTWLPPLAKRFHGTSSIGVLDGHEIVYLDRATAENSLSYAMSVGARLPAVTSSMGKVLLSQMVDADRAAVMKVAGLGQGARTKLEEELREAAQNGYALNLGGIRPGLNSAAVLLREPLSNRIYGALNIASIEIDPERLVNDVVPVLQDVAVRAARTEPHNGQWKDAEPA